VKLPAGIEKLKTFITELPARLVFKLGTSPYAMLLPPGLLAVGMLALFAVPQVFTEPAVIELHLPSEAAIPRSIEARSIDESDPEWLFRYGATGTEFRAGLPYWIYRIMPRLFNDRFKGQGYELFGFDADDQKYYKWRPLPRGLILTDTTLNVPLFKVSASIKRVAVNCSGCHRGEYLDGNNQRILVDGMPNHTGDLQGFKRFFGSAFLDPRFTADRVIDEIDRALVEEERKPRLNTTEEFFYRGVVALLKDATRGGSGEWMGRRADNGPGRIDPFNAVKFEVLHVPDDGTSATIDFPAIWNQRDGIRDWHHVDGNTRDSDARNYGSVIGVGGIVMSVNKLNVSKVGKWIDGLPSPEYPFSRPDPERVKRGAQTFVAQCAPCHGVFDRASGNVARVAGGRYMLVDTSVGTDPERWRAFPQEVATTLGLFGELRELWGKNKFRPADKGYLCGPLDGIWARAPYLHNGSVPTMAELLKPPEERVKRFYRGSRRYDEVDMGWVYDRPQENSLSLFEYDCVKEPDVPGSPPIPGNSNQGHRHPVAPALRGDLLEYLKTL
jgi:hypothetical protein